MRLPEFCGDVISAATSGASWNAVQLGRKEIVFTLLEAHAYISSCLCTAPAERWVAQAILASLPLCSPWCSSVPRGCKLSPTVWCSCWSSPACFSFKTKFKTKCFAKLCLRVFEYGLLELTTFKNTFKITLFCMSFYFLYYPKKNSLFVECQQCLQDMVSTHRGKDFITLNMYREGESHIMSLSYRTEEVVMVRTSHEPFPFNFLQAFWFVPLQKGAASSRSKCVAQVTCPVKSSPSTSRCLSVGTLSRSGQRSLNLLFIDHEAAASW